MGKKLKIFILLLVGVLVGIAVLILGPKEYQKENQKVEIEKNEKQVKRVVVQDFKSKEEIEQKFDGWIKMLRAHSSPKAGDIWEVTFLTKGKGGLEIVPQDERTINDLEFVSLTCGEKEIKPEIKEGGVIFVKDWQCGKRASLKNLVKVEGKHTLRFNFQAYYTFAYNSPDTVSDSFVDKSLIQDYLGVKVDTAAGEVKLNVPPKRVFLTGQSWTGNLGGTGAAIKKCNQLAQAAGLGGQWDAWISDSQSSPSTRFNKCEGGYIRLDGVWIARDWADLTDGGIRAPINLMENGNYVTAYVWTGTDPNSSTHGPTCNNWTSNSPSSKGICGSSSDTGQWWTWWHTDWGEECDPVYRLYCFEQ